MSVAFSTDDSNILNKRLFIDDTEKISSSDSLEHVYELNKCADWIASNCFEKVALQFPDSLLKNASSIALQLQEMTNKQTFVLGDTSYGSCCVDEIAAEHASADAVIHFGHACLCPSRRLPVLYIFGKYSLDVPDAVLAFQKLFPDTTCLVAIVYDVMFSYAIGSVSDNLKEYKNLVVSKLELPNEPHTPDPLENNENMQVTKCHRHFIIPNNQDLNNYTMFYIGCQNATLMNFMLSFNHCKFYSYQPQEKTFRAETLNVNKYLMNRYYYIEKAKDANIIGILVGTLGVINYLNIIKHLRNLIKEAGKKPYTLVVGKINAAKLANFAEIEVFVNVACMESSVVESREFYQPIITPYELEVALNQAREWTGEYITDFGDILPGSAKHIPSVPLEEQSGDVSLVTGKMRSFGINKELKSSATHAMASRNDMKLSTIHSQAAGQYLSERSWQGLEQKLGETGVCDIQQGKKGIACGYEDEISESGQN